MSTLPVQSIEADSLPVRVFATEDDMASAAAAEVNEYLCGVIATQGSAAAILAKPAVTNQAVCGCTPTTEVFNKYLFLYLLSQRESFRQQSQGGAQPNINAQLLGTLNIPLPPLEEQKRIASDLDDKIAGVKLAEASIQQELDTIEAMPAALLRKAFSGAL